MSLAVAITVDVEFTVGGAFEDPLHRRPIGAESVELRVGEEEAGLDFILNTLSATGLRGVFFVEALNTMCFGDAPMGEIARRIHGRGHDVQLHAHPCWLTFADADWQQRVLVAKPCDSFADLDNDVMALAVQTGLDAFSRWQLPRPRAFRAGNLQVDRRIYGCLKKAGIPIASNIGLGAYQPVDIALNLTGGRHWIDGVLEVPVSSYADVRLPALHRWKSFTVIGTGTWEARQWLASAARVEVDPVVILTHPSEFVHRMGDDYGRLRRNETARARLEQLCRFLADHPDKFTVVTFSERLDDWTGGQATMNPQWRISPLARAVRMIENRMSDARHAG